MQISSSKGLDRAAALCAGLCGLMLAASGCAYGHAQQVVRAQFASELNCPDAAAVPRKMYQEGYKPGQFVATGCGLTRTYSCPESDGLMSYDDKSCSHIDGVMEKAMEAPKPAAKDEADQAADDVGAMNQPEPEAAPAPKPAKPSPFKSEAKPSPFKAAAAAEASPEAGDVAPAADAAVAKPSPFKAEAKTSAKKKVAGKAKK